MTSIQVKKVVLGVMPRRGASLLLVLLLASICGVLGGARVAAAQAKESAEAGGLRGDVGGTASGYYVGYGQRKLLGYSAFVDAYPKGRPGVELEYRNLAYNQTANVHLSTYLAGVRWGIWERERVQLYVKALAGAGEFTFPYNYAHGGYLVVAPGAGVDFRLSRRVAIRVADFEYQAWPQFTYGNLPSWGVSSGIRIRVF